MLTEQEKQIPQLLADHEYMSSFFSSRAKEIDGRNKSLAKLEIHPIKKHVDDVFFHFVIHYPVTFLLADGSRKRFKIYCASHSANLRERKYQAMKLAYENGFKNGKVLVPRPLWYIKELEAVFYVGMQGENLLEHIKNGATIKGIIKKTAGFLAGFHQLKLTKEMKLAKHKFDWSYLDPTDILKRPQNKNHEFSKRIQEDYEKIKKYIQQSNNIKPELSHGDFHPENIIINRFDSEQIAIIDFSEVCLAPYAYDLGSFLQQLRFMTLAYDVSGEKYKKWEQMLLDEYFYRRKIKLDDANRKQINLYQAWTALKSAVYYMIFDDQYKFVKTLLDQIQEFLKEYEK